LRKRRLARPSKSAAVGTARMGESGRDRRGLLAAVIVESTP
jgi:hypothetical protein